MDIDKMREEYEVWATKNGISTVRTTQALMFANGQRRAAGDYIMVESICSWAAWQQSRASLEIELPAPAVAGGNCIRDHAIRDVLEAAGVKVKL